MASEFQETIRYLTYKFMWKSSQTTMKWKFRTCSYDAHESGLFYRFLPYKTIAAANEKTAPSGKIANNRITFRLVRIG